jgi:hypothetical protein
MKLLNCLLTACLLLALTPRMTEAQQSGSPAALRRMADEYYRWRNENFPVSSSNEGLHTWDNRLTDYTEATVAAQSGGVERINASPVFQSSTGPLAHGKTGADSSRAVSLCAPDEKTVWSCETTHRKIASICSSRQLDDHSGYVQYRFGRPGRVELEFPHQRQNTQSSFTYKRYTRPLVTYLAIKFTAGGHTYKIYDQFNDEEKPRRREAYISVLAPGGGAKTVDLNCRQPIAGTLMDLEDIVTKSTDDDLTEP